MELIKHDLEIKTTTKSNGDLAIQQTMARSLKTEMLKTLKDLIEATYEIDTLRNDEGIVMLVPNDDLGVIPVALDIKVKSLDYDYETATKDYNDKLKEKADKKAKTEQKKAKTAATTK